MTEASVGQCLPASDFFADAIGPHNAEEHRKKSRSFRHWVFFKEKIRPILDQLKGHYVAFDGLKQTWVNDTSKENMLSILEQKTDKTEYLMIRITEEGEVLVPFGTIEHWASCDRQLVDED